MRTILSLLFVVALCGSNLSAQNFGVRGGLNLTTISVDTDGANVSFDRQANLMLGLFLDLPLGGEKFMLSPELSFVGRSYGVDFDFLGTNIETKVNLAYLDLGVLAKYMIVDNGSVGFYVAAGPVVSYAMSGNVETNGDKEDIEFDDEDGFNRTNLNLAGAAGLTFGQKFFVEGRYMAGLSSLGDGEDGEGDTKWNSIGINGGVRIPLGN
ncbi:porin family protein [Neolewinella persica]|uniref:porin family protein n=1 Tax=Neolewinella persica TaxID=70998 RepID=UPI0003793453|nr:porin family protein [Neolewinella persica]